MVIRHVCVVSAAFFFAANCTALSLAHFREQVPRVYAADLLGAGVGSAGAVGLLFLILPQQALLVVAGCSVVAAGIAWWTLEQRPRWCAWIIVSVGGAVFLLPTAPLHISPYKELAQALHIADTRVVMERSSPLAWLTVVDSPAMPWRHAPGLSLLADQEPPPQLALFNDGDGMSAITRFDGELAPLSYLDQMTSALPYHLRAVQRAALLDSGTGAQVLQARYHGVAHIDAVELNPQVVELVTQDFAAFAGPVFAPPQVQIHVADARGFIANQAGVYDLISMTLPEPGAGGLHALHESYLYTVEAMQTYLEGLAPDGYFVVNGWVTPPPRDALKLIGTLIEALRRIPHSDPATQILLIRSWQTLTVVVKNGPFLPDELLRLKAFCRERGFDVAWYPGMPFGEANRYNILPEEPLFHGVVTLLGNEAPAYRDHYKFDLRPATDEQPFFFHFFKWSSLGELLTIRERGGMVMLEWGYLILIGTLVQAIIASVLFIWWPLRKRPRRSCATQGTPSLDPRIDGRQVGQRRAILLYFSLLGLAFLFVEIAFIQKLVLFLHHPVYAAAATITAFLVFAGLGSQVVPLCRAMTTAHGVLRWVVTLIGSLAIFYIIGLDALFATLHQAPLIIKFVVALLIIAPLAFCMGMPFPLGLIQIGRGAAELMPWAWGVNGCASVVSAVLATLIAIEAGFSTVILIAALLYVVAWKAFPWIGPSGEAG